MNRRLGVTGIVLAATLSQTPGWAQDLPRFQKNGEATQLMVDGKPYLALGGELHNSSPSSPAYMAPIWDQLARRNVRTVIGAASWELVEPEPGKYDFTAVDDQIKQAHARDMRLVLIWFGSYKNAESKYAPSWVRRNERDFPRAERAAVTPMGKFFTTMLSVFNDKLADADARAFAALMRHIKTVDRDQTVIMMQVQNEVGLLGDSRDRSALANAAYAKPVPRELMRYLQAHRGELRPYVAEAWARQNHRQSGTWEEVFGAGPATDEIFMAWGFGSYVERVARAGQAEYKLPMFANAWLGPQPGATKPGDYPSGGPVPRVMDVWKAAAPSLSLLAPDIYIEDFNGVLADYKRPNNPIFIPEAKFNAGNLFVAIGQHDAVGFNPFGIEDNKDDDEVFKAYAALNGMTDLITRAQSEGKIRGFKLAPGARQTETLGGYEIAIAGPQGTLGAFGAGTGSAEVKVQGYGLIVQTAADEFLVLGRGATLTFTAPGSTVEIDRAQEGEFIDGTWKPGRTLNGDERYALFPTDQLRAVRITVMRR